MSKRSRCDHLLRTFWTGEKGWREEQFADITIEWTASSGRTYTTTSGGALFFPKFAAPTETLTVVTRQPVSSEGRNPDDTDPLT